MILTNLMTDQDLLHKKKVVYKKSYNSKPDFLVQALWIDEALLCRD
jgi:hypothetical protein